MTYTGLSDILAEIKSAFLYHLRKAQLNLVKDDDKRSINTVPKARCFTILCFYSCSLGNGVHILSGQQWKYGRRKMSKRFDRFSSGNGSAKQVGKQIRSNEIWWRKNSGIYTRLSLDDGYL